MKSLAQKLEQIEGLTDTKDVTDWENQFIKDVAARVKRTGSTSVLSERQVETIDRIYGKHFA
jgi:hypothetical protein